MNSIFIWVLETSLMGSIAAIFILLIRKLLDKKMSIRFRELLWGLLIIRMLMPSMPQTTFSMFNLADTAGSANPIAKVDTLKKVVQMPKSSNTQILQSNPDKTTSNSTNTANSITSSIDVQKSFFTFSKIDLFNTAACVWLFGTVTLFILSFFQNLRYRNKLKSSKIVIEQDVLELFSNCKQMLGLNKNINLYTSKNINSPMLFGLIKPKILIPAANLSTISKMQMKYILLHELSHAKRNDILANIITLIIRYINWFNPLVWYAFYIMDQDREIACDAYFLEKVRDTSSYEYGMELINLSQIFKAEPMSLSHTGFLKKMGHIERRIIMLSKFKRGSYKITIIGAIVFILVASITLTNAASFKDAAKNIKGNTNKAIDISNAALDKYNPIIDVAAKNADAVKKGLLDTKVMRLNQQLYSSSKQWFDVTSSTYKYEIHDEDVKLQSSIIIKNKIEYNTSYLKGKVSSIKRPSSDIFILPFERQSYLLTKKNFTSLSEINLNGRSTLEIKVNEPNPSFYDKDYVIFIDIADKKIVKVIRNNREKPNVFYSEDTLTYYPDDYDMSKLFKIDNAKYKNVPAL